MVIKKIKEYLQNREKKRLIENIFSLSFLKAADFLLPLLTLPYLTRVLGPEKFGMIAFAQAFVQYFVLFTEYGFGLSATREVSINRDNRERISELFSSILFIKLLFLLLSFTTLILLISVFTKLRDNSTILIAAFSIVPGSALFPVWLFQGMEKMRLIAVLNIISKLLFTLSIFLIIKKAEHFYLVPLIQGSGYIVAGIISLVIVFSKYKIHPYFPGFKAIKKQIREGWYIFLSMGALTIYSNADILILGFFFTPIIVGYYAAAQKLMVTACKVFEPVNQAVYPYISKKIKESYPGGLRIIRKILFIAGSITLFGSLFIFIFSGLIVSILYGEEYRMTAVLLRIIAFVPFLANVSSILGVQTLLTLNHKKEYTKVIIINGILKILLSIILIQVLSCYGIALSELIVNFVSVVLFYCMLVYKNVHLFSFKEGLIQ